MSDDKTMTFGSVSQRVTDITEEFVTQLPDGSHHQFFWYDKTTKGFAVRRYKGKIDYYMILSQRHLTTHKKAGTLLPRHVKLAGMSLTEARAYCEREYKLLDEKTKELREKNKEIPRITKRNHIDLLKPRVVKDNPNYDALMNVLMEAFGQAAYGKGNDRHGGLDFEDQDMISIMDEVGVGFGLGQAMKKLSEGNRLKKLEARKEWLGAIIYIAGTIVWLDRQK